MTPVPIRQAIKLSTPVPDFSFFVEDQVLTAEQLNRLIQYLDYQARSTRAWLFGTGIVCGLRLTVTATSVTLSSGCALTSDGDLLAIESQRVFTHVREFLDDKAAYGPLGGGSVPLLELLTAEQAASEPTAVSLSAATTAGQLVVLYLESYVKEPDVCTDTSCDNVGPVQNNQFRVLLVPEAQLPPGAPTTAALARELPEVIATRARIQEGTIDGLLGATGLQQKLTAAIQSTRTELVAALTAVTQRESGLSAAMTGNAATVSAALPAVPNFNTVVTGLPYIYAFYRDVCQAYMEWRSALFRAAGACDFAPAVHQKHVVLGRAVSTVDCPPDPNRHVFRRSAAVAPCSDGLVRARLLWQRLAELVTRFTAGPSTSGIRITPCAGPDQPLGKRARPVYYGATFTGPWDVEARLECRTDAPVSYFGDATNRLSRDLSGVPFYRIEGHIGLTLEEAQTRLEQLREQHNLAFHIIAVQIETNPDTAVVPNRRFLDVETLFYAYKADFQLRLRDIDAYADIVSQKIDGARGRIPTQGPDGRPLPDIVEAIQATGQLKTAVGQAWSALPKSIAEFGQVPVLEFMSSYTAAVDQGHRLNKNTYSVAQNLTITPAEKLIQPELPARFGQLLDLLQKRRRKVAELSTFEKFVQKNPGLEHLGGVFRGGTFILVYSASTNPEQRIVRADFCLPHCSCFDITMLEQEEAPADPVDTSPPPYVFVPPRWEDNYTWDVSWVTDKVLGDHLLSFEGLLDDKIINVQTLFDDKVSGLEGYVNGKINGLEGYVNDKVLGLEGVIDEKLVGINKAVDDKLLDFGRTYDDKFIDFGRTYDDKFVAFGRTYDDKIAGLETTINQQIVNIERSFDSRVQGVEQEFDKQFQELVHVTLPSQVQENVTTQFVAFTNMLPLINANIKQGLTVGATDVLGGAAMRDERYSAKINATVNALGELKNLRRQVELGIADPKTPQRIQEVETYLAELTKGIVTEVAESAVSAEAQGKLVGEVDRSAATLATQVALELQSSEAKEVLGVAFRDVSLEHKESAFVKQSFGRAAALFK